jgi:hypothetical protein
VTFRDIGISGGVAFHATGVESPVSSFQPLGHVTVLHFLARCMCNIGTRFPLQLLYYSLFTILALLLSSMLQV